MEAGQKHFICGMVYKTHGKNGTAAADEKWYAPLRWIYEGRTVSGLQGG
jgi:hypothetical protein